MTDRDKLIHALAAAFSDDLPADPEDDAKQDKPFRGVYEGVADKLLAAGWCLPQLEPDDGA